MFLLHHRTKATRDAIHPRDNAHYRYRCRACRMKNKPSRPEVVLAADSADC
jgi:hypothetical protein